MHLPLLLLKLIRPSSTNENLIMENQVTGTYIRPRDMVLERTISCCSLLVLELVCVHVHVYYDFTNGDVTVSCEN